MGGGALGLCPFSLISPLLSLPSSENYSVIIMHLNHQVPSYMLLPLLYVGPGNSAILSTVPSLFLSHSLTSLPFQVGHAFNHQLSSYMLPSSTKAFAAGVADR